MTTDDFPTTRRFPRTLSDAFPASIERAAVIEVGPRPLLWRVWRALRVLFNINRRPL